MATKAIKQRMNSGTKMTKAQKLRVLKDTRELLSNRKNWTKGAFVEVKNVVDPDYGSRNTYTDGVNTDDLAVKDGKLVYVPSEAENAAMCVMGAVAFSAGFDGDPTDSAQDMVRCSLASILIESLPKSWGLKERDLHRDWIYAMQAGSLVMETKFTRTYEAEYGEYQRTRWTHAAFPKPDDPSLAEFRKYLKQTKQSLTDLYVSIEEGEALDMIYTYNDASTRKHADILRVLDRAIAKLEA